MRCIQIAVLYSQFVILDSIATMSRLARKPIELPSGVTLERRADELICKGPKGEKSLRVLPGVSVSIEGNAVSVKAGEQSRQAAMNVGTMWSLIRNAVSGLTSGFSKTLEIQGVGYRAVMEGGALVLSLGYAHPVRVVPHKGITIEVEKNAVKVSGIDKELVGHTAAYIRSLKKPEPYKGKGIQYAGEVVKIKAGKKAASAGAG
jgi:large subunit ribosomal protein L6